MQEVFLTVVVGCGMRQEYGDVEKFLYAGKS
jgi:hypothetical protein